MRFLKINYTHYYLFTAISLVLLLNFNGCRDLQYCRSIYTNEVWIEFKGETKLEINKLKYHKPANKHSAYKKDKPGNEILNNLKDEKLRIYLHPKNNIVSLLFYKAPVDPTAPKPAPDTLTIFYKRIFSLLSPYCGLQEEYIIGKVETTFAGNKIIKPALRNKKYETDQEEFKKPNIEIYY